jgi:hypothetical protein
MLNKVMLGAAEQIGKLRKVVETPLFYVIQSLSYILIKEIPILLYFFCSRRDSCILALSHPMEFFFFALWYCQNFAFEHFLTKQMLVSFESSELV